MTEWLTHPNFGKMLTLAIPRAQFYSLGSTGSLSSANTAKFTGDLGKADGQLKTFAGGVKDAGRDMEFSMREARGSLMLIGDEFGVHLPREIRTMIAELPGVGMALEALLPIMAGVFAVTLIYKWMEASKKSAQEVADAWTKYGDAVNGAFEHVEDRLLRAGVKADELAGDHIGALIKQLQLVDRQTMSDIISELDKVGKAADDVFGKMQSNWFMQLIAGRADVGPAKGELTAMVAEINKLKGSGVDPGNATRALLGTDIDEVRGEITAIQGQIRGFSAENLDARRAGDAMASDSNDRRIRAAQQQLQLEQQNLSTLQQMQGIATTDAAAGKQEKGNLSTESDNAEAQRQQKLYDAQQRGLEQRRKAEERYAKEQEKMAQNAALVSGERGKAEYDRIEYEKERDARAAAAMAAEELRNWEASARIKAAAEDQDAKHRLDMKRSTRQQAMDAEVTALRRESAIQGEAQDRAIANLDKNDAAYYAHHVQHLNRKFEAIQRTEDAITRIQERAEEDRYRKVKQAEDRMADAIAQNVARSVFQGKNLVQSMEQTFAQMGEMALQNAIKMALIGDMQQARDAGHAAASAYKWVMQEVPYPASAVIAPAAAALAFAGVMSYDVGGEIPGSGPVPIMAHGGETVVTRELTEQVKSARGGGQRGEVHIHTTLNVVDGNHFDKLLTKHAAIVSRHVQGELRKMNR